MVEGSYHLCTSFEVLYKEISAWSPASLCHQRKNFILPISSIVASCQKWYHFPVMMLEMKSIFSQVIKKIANLL